MSQQTSLTFKSLLVSPTIAGVDCDGSPEDVTVILNSPTSLVCEAYSYPPATITWFKDGTPLESNRNIRILPGTVHFRCLRCACASHCCKNAESLEFFL